MVVNETTGSGGALGARQPENHAKRNTKNRRLAPGEPDWPKLILREWFAGDTASSNVAFFVFTQNLETCRTRL
jgi:hypothetical protein